MAQVVQNVFQYQKRVGMDPSNIPNQYFGHLLIPMDLSQFWSFKTTSDPQLFIGDPQRPFTSDPTNDPISDPTSDPTGVTSGVTKKKNHVMDSGQHVLCTTFPNFESSISADLSDLSRNQIFFE